MNKQKYEVIKDEIEKIISDNTCTKDNALEIGLILVIEGIDDVDMFSEEARWQFMEALDEVEGTYQKVATGFHRFFFNDEITLYTLDQILEAIF